MVDYAKDNSYARSRLVGSVVMWNNRPYFVNDIVSDGTVLAHNLMGTLSVEFPLKEVNNSEFPLGFMNGNTLRYIVRKPARQYKQGLRDSNLIDIIGRHSFSPSGRLGFAEMLAGIYPDVNTAMERVEVEGIHTAFNRKFAIGDKGIGNSYALLHKHHNVGNIYLSDFGIVRFELDDAYNYLEEQLREGLEYV